MVGMGKAMSEWVLYLPETMGQNEREGLGRIRDTLLDAAGKEVDEIVKEWGWHDGLETTSSRGETPISTPGSPAIPLTESIPPISLSRQDPGPSRPKPHAPPPIDAQVASVQSAPIATAEEVTPTPQAVAAFTSPSLPTNPSAVRSARGAGPSKALPYLSRTTDRPSPGLTRTPPVSAPLPRDLTSSPHPLSPDLTSSETGDTSRVIMDDLAMQDRRHASDPLDPLAGLGVSVGGRTGVHTKKNRGGGVVDPLLGLGLR